MGSCASVQKYHHPEPVAMMKLQESNNIENENQLLNPSPIKENHQPPSAVANAADHGFATNVRIKSKSFPTSRDLAGSKEETFFDSQPWLESDCEDDFYSVNGEFTPSRGNTPSHHVFSVGTPRSNRLVFPEKSTVTVPEPFPKKKLFELFKESLRAKSDPTENENDQFEKTQAMEISRKSDISRANFVCASFRIRKGGSKKDDTLGKSGSYCFPKICLNGSFSGKRKKKSPCDNV